MRIPTPQAPGREVGSVQTEAANTPFSNVRGVNPNEAFSRDLAQIGQGLEQMGQQIEINNREIAERDLEREFKEWELAAIHDPVNGLKAKHLGDAIGSSNAIASAVAQKRAELEEKYGSKVAGRGKIAVGQWLDAAELRVRGQAMQHELAQGEAYRKAQAEGRIEQSGDMITTNWYDPETIGAELNNIEQAVIDANPGLDGPALESLVEARRTQALMGAASEMLVKDPNGVEAWVEDMIDAGMMDETEGRQFLQTNRSAIIHHKARHKVDAAAITSNRDPAVRVNGSPAASWADAMGISESSGRYDVQRTNEDGRRFVGKYQFGQDRLQDAINAGFLPRGYTLDNLLADPSMQESLLRWHVADIDKWIDDNNVLDKGFDRDGLRAIAHLGGKGGMMKWVMGYDASTGTSSYSPSDELGTSLTNYYNKFASGGAGGVSVQDAIQLERDPEVRREMQSIWNSDTNAAATATRNAQTAVRDDFLTRYDQAVLGGDQAQIDAVKAELDDPEFIKQVGSDNYRNIVKLVRAPDTETNPYALQSLERLRQGDPQQFVDADILSLYGDQLSPEDTKSYLKLQSTVAAQLKKPEAMQGTSIGTLNTDISRLRTTDPDLFTKAAGGGGRGAAVSDEVFDVRFAQRAYEATVEFEKLNGRKPTVAERNSMMRNMLNSNTVALFNPSGPANQISDATLVEVGVAADKYPLAQFLTPGEFDFNISYELPGGGSAEFVPDEGQKKYYADMYRKVYKVEPRPSDVIALMFRYPPEEIEELMNE